MVDGPMASDTQLFRSCNTRAFRRAGETPLFFSPRMMRISARSLATLLLAAGLATCSDTPIAAVRQSPAPARAGFGRVGFAPVFSKTAQYVAQHAADFGIDYDSVR